jgi:hypothetical protein
VAGATARGTAGVARLCTVDRDDVVAVADRGAVTGTVGAGGAGGGSGATGLDGGAAPAAVDGDEDEDGDDGDEDEDGDDGDEDEDGDDGDEDEDGDDGDAPRSGWPDAIERAFRRVRCGAFERTCLTASRRGAGLVWCTWICGFGGVYALTTVGCPLVWAVARLVKE